MIYQLPTGEVIDIPLEEYLAVSDGSFDYYIRSARYKGKFSINLPRDEYSPDESSSTNWDNYHNDDDLEIEDNRTLNQIINDMPEDNPE